MWIAESEDDATALTDALRAGDFNPVLRRVASDAELLAELSEHGWNVAVCSVRGSVPPSALAALDHLEADLRPPLILIADRFESAALESYRWSALVCLRDRLFLQLTAAVDHVLLESSIRREQRRARAFELGQREVLERIAAGAPLGELLEHIVRLIEAQADGMLCSILILDGDRLRHGATSTLPRKFISLIDGQSIGPRAGSCGTAAFRNERVVVEDIATHPLWEHYRQHAVQFGLRACWSSPIVSPAREVLGTFAMYYCEPRGPTPREQAWVDRATHLASIAMLRDRAEQGVRRSEARYRQIVDTAYEGVWLLDAEGKTSFANQRCLELFGYTAAELHERSWLELLDAASRTAGRDVWQRAQLESQQFELGFRRKDGAQFWAIVAASPVRDDEGRADGVLCMLTDVSELRQAELALRQRQRMESLGTLAGGIAHDFNNILTAIAGNVALVLGDVPADHPAQQWMLEIDSAVKRAAELVRRILTFSRQNETDRQAVRVSAVVDEALTLLRATLPESIALDVHYASELPEISADATQLHQVVMNLATNAVHAMQESGGELRLSASSLAVGTPRKAAGSTELRAGRYVKLDVSDTGVGMDAATLERIFDPFFTTREPGGGTGLGLSVVHGIVKAHEGAIDVESTPGQGTHFSIYLPVAQRTRSASEVTRRAPHARGEGERILCLDDEPPVVRVATQVLRRLGYQVTGFADSLQALEHFRMDPSAYDLLLTDFAMPQLTGLELVAAFQKLRPGLPVVVTSGRIDDEEVAALQAAGVRELLMKPSSVSDLSAAVRRALQHRR
ncbi:MAG TPA: ATP-binding protein [Polyangiales bacterium]|nr:ATP-binding protein [Polyangiales bacterium]